MKPRKVNFPLGSRRRSKVIRENAARVASKAYEAALKMLKLQTLEKRRDKLILSYGKQCLKVEQTKHLFPMKQTEHNMSTRTNKKYKENKAHTERYKKSAVPYIQRLLNS